VRSFNRFYTRQIGLLNQGLYHSHFSLTEVRVLYELAHRQSPSAVELGKDLHLDAGYLSRMLGRFQKQGLISRSASNEDGRRSLLSLTQRGKKEFSLLDKRSSQQIDAMLKPLTAGDRQRLVRAMGEIQSLLEAPEATKSPYILRPHKPGDIGWVIHR